MKKINIAINTRNTFLRESLVSMVNELTVNNDNLAASFSYKHNDFLDKDIIIAEVLPELSVQYQHKESQEKQLSDHIT